MTVKTKIPGFEIRVAAAEDAGTILSLIRELAEYEKMAHEVVASEDDLRRALFGEGKVAEAVLGCYEGEVVGFALFFHNFSTFLGKPGLYLEDLYVQPEMRGKGFGRALLAYLARLARERGCGRFEWSVLDWNEPAIDFYRKLGAQPMDEWTTFRLTGAPLEKLADEY